MALALAVGPDVGPRAESSLQGAATWEMNGFIGCLTMLENGKAVSFLKVSGWSSFKTQNVLGYNPETYSASTAAVQKCSDRGGLSEATELAS